MPTPIPVGQPAPDFSLPDQHGKTRSLKDYRGRTVVLYFYPEDDTPLCTAQACQFRDHHPDFTKIKAVVLGISPDSGSAHKAFADKHALPFTLLSDVPDAGGNLRVCTRYGAWGEKNMYGKVVRGMLRTTYLIGPDGKVARRWDRVKTPGHAAAVLAAVKALHGGERLTKLGEVKPIRSLSAKARKASKQKTRTQGGHAGYSGVASTKGKKSRARSIVAQSQAGRSTSRGSGGRAG